MKTHRILAATLLVAAALAAPTGESARGASGQAVGTGSLGTLQLEATFSAVYRFGNYCPPGTPATVACVRFVGVADVPGLGHATATYVKTVFDPRYGCIEVTQLPTAVIAVAGKGEVGVSMAEPVCSPVAPAETGPLEGTITGGSGTYAGASGRVQFKSSVYAPSGCTGGPCGFASDTWTGALVVPGLDFDLTPPELSGAAPRIARAPKGAKRVRVRYTITARDAVDGSVPVACTPRSGSLFKIGRTNVTCTAEDSSANKATAKFTVIVKRKGQR